MNVAIFEVCRNPEIRKQTETLLLSQAFERLGISCQVYSNDGIWSRRTFLNPSLLQNALSDGPLDAVHLALHGDRDGLVLGWSQAEKNPRSPSPNPPLPQCDRDHDPMAG